MQNLIRMLVLGTLCAVLTSCRSNESAEVTSVIRQLAAADKRIESDLTLEKLRNYVAELTFIDVSKCPREFIAAWDRHLAAVEAVYVAALNRPSPAEAAMVGFAAGYSGHWDTAARSIAQELASSRQVQAELDAARAHLAAVSIRYAAR